MKKIILVFAVATTLFSCMGKDEYVITGEAKGFENGKTVILETQEPNGGGLKAIDTVKIENGKFEIKNKVAEPAFYLLQLEGAQGKIPFILEPGKIKIEVYKDSIQKSKVSGTYSNDEYVSFNVDLVKIQKKLYDFQTKNTTAMNAAQQAKDTTAINNLMREFTKIQQEVGEASKTKYLSYAETHPKSFITVLIIEGMLNDPTADSKKFQTMYDNLEDVLKNTKSGKAIKAKLDQLKATAPAAPAAAK
jgi:hypothetical protein